MQELSAQAIRKDIPLALYYQIKEKLRQNIQSGEWTEGSRIPSEQEICALYGVSRITVRKAIEELQSEKYLEKRQGRGTFVQTRPIGQNLSKFYSFSEELKRQGIREHSRVVSFERLLPDAEIKKGLSLSEGEEVFRVKRIRMIDEKPYAVENSFIPVRFAPELTGDTVQKSGLYKSLGMYGVFLNRATETFSAINLSREDARDMQVDTGAAAINLLRVTWRGEDVVEYCRSLVRGDIFHYTVELK